MPAARSTTIKGDFSQFGLDPDPPPVMPTPFVTSLPVLLGKEDLPVEEKARILADVWMNNVTPEDLAKMKAGEIRKIGEMAGIGIKKDSPTTNPIILAIINTLASRNIAPPALECNSVELEGERVDE